MLYCSLLSISFPPLNYEILIWKVLQSAMYSKDTFSNFLKLLLEEINVNRELLISHYFSETCGNRNDILLLEQNPEPPLAMEESCFLPSLIKCLFKKCLFKKSAKPPACLSTSNHQHSASLKKTLAFFFEYLKTNPPYISLTGLASEIFIKRTKQKCEETRCLIDHK